jgi:hypothetical protein
MDLRRLILTPAPSSLRRILDRALAGEGRACRPVVQAENVSLMIDLIDRGLPRAPPRRVDDGRAPFR